MTVHIALSAVFMFVCFLLELLRTLQLQYFRLQTSTNNYFGARPETASKPFFFQDSIYSPHHWKL